MCILREDKDENIENDTSHTFPEWKWQVKED